MKRKPQEISLSDNVAARALVSLLARRSAERRMRQRVDDDLNEKPESARKGLPGLVMGVDLVQEDRTK